MLRRLTIVLDCPDPVALAPFWVAALGYEQVWDNESYVVMIDPDKEGPVFALQKVPEAKAGKNRMHIDLHAPELEEEIARMTALGATQVGSGSLDELSRWAVMTDPAGNEFCVVSP